LPAASAVELPALLARLKLAGVVAPEVVAVTLYDPAVVLAVKICDVATPLEFVISMSVAATGLVANVPLAPVAGAVNVTDTPLAGDPFDNTVAESVPNGLPTVCGDVYPLALAVIVIVGPVVFEL